MAETREYPTYPTKRIAITGTKGKSTICYLLASIIRQLGDDVLRVDTTGHYINGEQKSTLQDSLRLSGLVPTVAPGRYLATMQDFPEFTAVLEAALGSSGPGGLGYKHHDVGIFTNVYEDHLGSSKRLKTKADIAEAKKFIFARLIPNGYAVFNAADKLVCSQLDALDSPDITQVACLIDQSTAVIDLDNHLQKDGVIVTLDEGQVIIRTRDGQKAVADATKIGWTFKIKYQPSLWNLLFVAGGLYGWSKGQLPKQTGALIERSQLDPYGGRLTPLKAKNGVLIIADYAHEKQSLAAIGDLARKLTGPSGKVIGVVRLAYDRTDDLIRETGEFIASHYDQFVVFDKIDGYWKKPKPTLGSFKQVVGLISEKFTTALRSQTPHVERIVREDEAIARAAQLAKSGDVVVCIVNDDIRRSIDFMREAFDADFV